MLHESSELPCRQAGVDHPSQLEKLLTRCTCAGAVVMSGTACAPGSVCRRGARGCTLAPMAFPDVCVGGVRPLLDS